MKKFGTRSINEINTMVDDLALIFMESIKVSDIDFGVTQGARSVEQQLEYFLDGKSKIDPRKYSESDLVAKAKHIVNSLEPKSRAGDIYAFVPTNKKLAYDEKHLCFIAGVITATANRLFAENKIKTKIRWGGNWDRDGEIITDQKFQDLPHFEIYQP